MQGYKLLLYFLLLQRIYNNRMRSKHNNKRGLTKNKIHYFHAWGMCALI